jgi:uncharacterized membrane protein
MVFRGVLRHWLCCLALIVSSFFRWHKPDAVYLLVGGLLYLVGTILVTIIFNVPLNDALAAADPTTADASRVWTTYVQSWTPLEPRADSRSTGRSRFVQCCTLSS